MEICKTIGRVREYEWDVDKGLQFGGELSNGESFKFPYNARNPKLKMLGEILGKRVKITVEVLED